MACLFIPDVLDKKGRMGKEHPHTTSSINQQDSHQTNMAAMKFLTIKTESSQLVSFTAWVTGSGSA